MSSGAVAVTHGHRKTNWKPQAKEVGADPCVSGVCAFSPR